MPDETAIGGRREVTLPVEPTPNQSTAGSGGGPSRGKPLATLGDFELRAEIGRGGMGMVYEAWQRSLSRRVALKVLGNTVSVSRNAVLRFQREAQAAAKLSHPHILPIYAQGQQDGVYYYAMELVPGPGLNALIAQARERCSSETAASPEVADTVALSRADELSLATADTVIIRQTELPPGRPGDSSIVLMPPGEVHTSDDHFRLVARHIGTIADALDYAHKRGVIHRDIKPHNLLFCADGRLAVSDFGLARLVEEPGVTLTGEFLGSPLYMSIEQISQGPSGVDHRTDIYSLGATMYEWLTLRPPFPGDSREQVISRILHAEAPPPCELNPAIPLDLETICLKAIDKDPARRYQTAAEMRDDLNRFLGSAPIRARRANPLARIRKFLGRHQVAVVLLSAVVMAGVLGEELFRSRREVHTQTTARQKQQADTKLLLEDLLRRISPETKGVAVTIDTVGPLIAEFLKRGPESGRSAEALFTSGPNASAAGTPLGLARRAAKNLYSDKTVDVSSPDVDDAPASEAERRLLAEAEGETDPHMQIQLTDRVLEMNPRSAAARRLGAMACCASKDYPRMLVHAEEYMALCGDDVSALLWHGLASLMMEANETAVNDFTRAVELDGLSAWTRTLRGLALLRSERAEDALLDLTTAVSIDPDLTIARLGRAAAYATLTRYDRAVEDVTRALALEPGNADALALRGEYRSALGQYAEAAQDFDEAMQIGGRNAIIMMQYLVTQSKIPGDGGAPAAAVEDGAVPADAVEEAGRPADGGAWGLLDRIFGTGESGGDNDNRRSRFDYPAVTF